MVGGWGQVSENDCGNTYALVYRLQSARMVMAVTAEMDGEEVQLDVRTASLYANNEKEVFVEATPGFERTAKDGVQRLIKLGASLYGLAQRPRNWWKDYRPSLHHS